MAPLLEQGLASSGVVRTMPIRDVVYGPSVFQGLGVPNLFTFQQTQHILRVLQFCRDKDHITGQLIRHSLEATKLELGCDGPVLLMNYDELGYLATSTWMTHLWKFLSDNHMGMEDSLPELELQREGDQYLIRSFLSVGYKGDQLRRLNRCRIFLKVVTVADIATGCGTFLSTAGWQGRVDETRMDRYEWPRQGEPSVKDWNLWREALQVSLCSRQRVLQRRLGRWFAIASTRWYYDERFERLYVADHQTLMYPRVSGHASRSAARRFQNPIKVDAIPGSAVKATVEFVRSTVVLTGWAETVSTTVSTNPSLHAFIESSVPKNAKWAIERFSADDDGEAVAEAIRRGSCIGVSDGSFKDHFGTACWILKASDGDISGIKCPCVVPGGKASHSAYRSELAGLYGMAVMVQTICAFHKITEGRVVLACDGLQALRHAAQFAWSTDSRSPQFDLLMATRSMLRKCPVELGFRHVKGRQDDDFQAELDDWALLNIEMDDGAKEHWHRCKDQRSVPPYVHGEPWPLWVAGNKVTKDVAITISDHIEGNELREYWESKERFGTGSADDIHWEAVGKAMSAVGRTRRQWVVKHASGFCATGKMLQRWKQQESAKCIRCDAVVEDARHVWLCKGEGVQTRWDQSIKKLREWMTMQQTQPNLANVICDRLSAWRLNIEPKVKVLPFLGLRDTVQLQDEVGWQAFLEGTPVKQWAEVQQCYYDWIKSKKSGERWLAAVIQKVWDVAWDLWEHRNSIVHAKDSSAQLMKLQMEIKAEFEMGPATVTTDARILFRPGLDTILKGDEAQQTAWLIRIQRARVRFQERLAERQDSFRVERTVMSRWLGRSASG